MPTNQPPTPPLNVLDPLAFLRSQPGMQDVVKQMEQKLGINFKRIEESLAAYIGTSNETVMLKSVVRKLAIHHDPVLIQGETGTGKELVARALASNLEGPFIAINCAGIPRELVESELFGYSKGSFTGAGVDKKGLFETAGNGTLMLDEIGDMPLDMQAKLLRVLQENTVRPIGGSEEKPIKCRFIAASHFDLAVLVAEKKFRRDLFARLSTFVLKISPLKCRTEDAAAIWDSIKGNDKKIPGNTIAWDKVDLSFNVRSVQQLYRRFVVLDEKPPTNSVTSLA